MNIVRNAFLENLGTDFVAIADNGHPVCRANDEDTVRRAVPHAALYLTGDSPELAELFAPTDSANLVGAAEGSLDAAADLAGAPAEEPEGTKTFDHDGDGKAGGSPKGDESTAHKGAERKKAATKAK
jgi:hypothetical protein